MHQSHNMPPQSPLLYTPRRHKWKTWNPAKIRFQHIKKLRIQLMGYDSFAKPRNEQSRGRGEEEGFEFLPPASELNLKEQYSKILGNKNLVTEISIFSSQSWESNCDFHLISVNAAFLNSEAKGNCPSSFYAFLQIRFAKELPELLKWTFWIFLHIECSAHLWLT